jgi:pyruvate/2-oxoglutarate dehydrogenase complex dihydrolipoamide dehydrogenase (E3) component
MTREFDVLVIGTGTSGYTLALACREAERSVAVADNRPYGGTCAMRGCQPKKYLVAASGQIRQALSHQSWNVDRLDVVAPYRSEARVLQGSR